MNATKLQRICCAAFGLLALMFSPAWAGEVTAIVNVSVIPMDRDRVLDHHTVIIEDGRIRAVGPSRRTPVPSDATVVDGRGRFVIPGLADMHTHVDNPEDFPLLLRAGVTTTLNIGGASAAYRGDIRAALRARRQLGPYPLTALMIDGPGDEGGSAVVPTTEAEARDAVRSARREGHDFIKIYSRLRPDMFDVVMDEARRQRIPVVGHVVRSVGLEEGLRRGQVMIAHGEEYLTVFNDASPDAARIPDLVDLSRRYGVAVTGNVAGISLIAEQWGNRDAVSVYLARNEALLMREALRDQWRRSSYQRLSGSYRAEARFVADLVAALHAGGVPILVGTDTPSIPGVPPGASVIDEIVMLQTLGFSRFEALAAATREPGKFVHRTLPREQRFGQIRRGFRADLVLLRSNPLNDLEALRTPDMIWANGHPFSPLPDEAPAP